jgi:pimeloyl-ACP methyl ester carboxylesterase
LTAISIVLVHGLTGNRDKTWTHSNGTFWSQHLLPEDIPNARIMTFGYDADVVRFWTLAGSNRLQDHGKSLAYALLDQRYDLARRPIIFIAHSLGGLVCEAALTLSDKRSDLGSILASTLGIIFLGTPHSGSDLANWGVKVAQYVNIFRGVNSDVLRNLQPGSSDVQQVEDDFQHLLRREAVEMNVFCFYEELKMNDVVGKIVEDWSAVLRGYDSCSIHANHRDMTKFSGRSDVGYGQVLGVLKRWIREGQRGSQAAGSEERDSTAGRKAHGGDGGIVFNGPISGRNVIAGTQTLGGTTNFNFN